MGTGSTFVYFLLEAWHGVQDERTESTVTFNKATADYLVEEELPSRRAVACAARWRSPCMQKRYAWHVVDCLRVHVPLLPGHQRLSTAPRSTHNISHASKTHPEYAYFC